MKLTVSALSVLSLCASASAQEDWVAAAVSEREATLQFFAKNRELVDAAILSLVDELPQPSADASSDFPEGEAGETVAESDGGMLFDVANARMVYLNNVRVTDPRAKLRCAERLYIQLPMETLNEGKQEAVNSVTPQQGEETTPDTPAESAPPDAEISGGVIEADVGIAMINTVKHKALLLGKSGATPALRIVQGNNRLLLNTPEGQSPALVLADDNGDIYICAEQIDIQWEDTNGKLCRLQNQNGRAYYRAESGKLLLEGRTEIQSPEGSMCCTEEMCLTLTQEARETDDDSSLMPQFGKMRITGIAAATAKGDIKATRMAEDGSLLASVSGSELTYNGTTGACRISGENTVLVFKDNSLSTNGDISLAENGDIVLQGELITGAYSRPAESAESSPLCGSFTTGGKIVFTAADGIIRMPSGLSLKDDACTLNIGGAVELVLQQTENAHLPKREQMGMINAAIATYADVKSIKAVGGVALQYLQGAEQKELSITAETADIDLTNGTAKLTSATGATKVSFDSYNLTAETTDGDSLLELSPSGDLTMKGDKLTATLPTHEGDAVINCTESLTLNRETGRLELGAGAHMEAPQGRLTANGPLYLTLKHGDPQKDKPLLPDFPHLVYNFDGLQQADTASGGTVQTTTAAMRCTGSIHVSLNTETDNGRSKSPIGSINLATAEGDVAITGKDNTGKIITAYGDKLSINGHTGEKQLTGRRVILQDKDNTHTASGGDAAIILDKHNNIRVTGTKQSTSATNIRKQVEKQQKNKK